MRLEDIFSASRNAPVSRTSLHGGREEDDTTIAAFSGQKDTVSISAEARAAYEAEASAKEDAEKQEEDPLEAFQGYMRKAKSDESESGVSEEKIKKLKEKLQALQNELAQVAGDETMPEETKTGMMQTLQAQIGQVAAQLGELHTVLSERAG